MRSQVTTSIMSSKLRWRMREAWDGSNSTTPGEHKALALWAADCAEHVLRYFEDEFPNENQPRRAIEAARAWTHDEITMTEARNEAISTHAVAREIELTSAREAARAAGHAAATAHVDDHAKAAANYALKAIAAASEDDAAIDTEIDWQCEQLPPKLQSIITTDT